MTNPTWNAAVGNPLLNFSMTLNYVAFQFYVLLLKVHNQDIIPLLLVSD